MQRTRTDAAAGRIHLAALVSVLAGLTIGVAAKPVQAEDVTTLEDITIEGEIAMPQVLFITARDQYRYRDGLHRDFLPSAEHLAASMVLPVGFWFPEMPVGQGARGSETTPELRPRTWKSEGTDAMRSEVNEMHAEP